MKKLIFILLLAAVLYMAHLTKALEVYMCDESKDIPPHVQAACNWEKEQK